jgi:hypothetical protein
MGVVPAKPDLPHPCALYDVLQVMLCGPNRVPIQVVRREVGTPASLVMVGPPNPARRLQAHCPL